MNDPRHDEPGDSRRSGLPALEPTGQLAPQPWMEAAETRAVIEALAAGGSEVRFVGGCVRDALLRRPVNDIDIATPEPPERVMERLAAAGIRAIPTGIDHGTVTAVVGSAHFEITTLRRDVETYGRRAAVAFSRDWTEDAARRDLTINALSCSPDGAVYDPFGGLEDLAEGRIRFVGRALDRIDEDVLRLLRFFRFYARYGRPPPDAEALAACRARAHRLHELSGERVAGELLRLLRADDPAGVILLMRSERVLPHLLPQAGQVGVLRMLAWLETRAIRYRSVEPDPLRRLAALLDATPDQVDALAARLRLSNRQHDRLATLCHPPLRLESDAGDDERRVALYRLGADTVRDLALLRWAGRLAELGRLPAEETERWRALIAATEEMPVPRFPLRGRDVIGRGVPRGPRVGRLVRAVEAWWTANGCRPDRADCLRRLDDLIAREGEDAP